MATHRIVCTEQEPCFLPPTHAHIVAVGINSSGGALGERRLTLSQVIALMELSEVFYTYGEMSQKKALVQKAVCPHCRRPIIKSAPDSLFDNNLDSLRYCNWQS